MTGVINLALDLVGRCEEAASAALIGRSFHHALTPYGVRASYARAYDLARLLSIRERDCIGFVAGGKSDWEIGIILGIAQTTAPTHVENAKRKLGAKTRAQAAARAVALGLI